MRIISNSEFSFFLIFLLPLTIFAQSTKRIYLSGKGPEDAVEWQFYCTDGRKSGEWTTIPVPSCWELQGFGTYNYGHDPDEERGKEQGFYKYTFSADPAWKNMQVNLVFEGSMTDTKVQINGKSAGPIHQGAFYRFKYNISDLLKYGSDNLLEVTVSKHSANESVNEAERRSDYWIFGGIFRPVYLDVMPVEHIDHISVDPKANGHLQADIMLENIKKADRIGLQLFTLQGVGIGDMITEPIEHGATQISVSAQYEEINSWSPEFPNLYLLKISLLSGNRIIHLTHERIGFRTVEIRERDGVYVNGIKIRFKGVCRHSFWPESGRTTGKELSIRDVSLIKEMNMNAVRMSHYPPDVHFLNVCDSLGLFVLDELAGWQAAYDTGVGKMLVREMVLRDVNHPSIVIWDNGNEGGWNTDLDDEFSKYDPQQREVIHPFAKFRKTDTNHYIDYNYGTNDSFNGTKVFFPTEFLHGLYDGGLGAGLDDYWDLMLSRPRAAGGFLWDFADEAVLRTDMDGFLDSDGNHAPDGILGPHHEKEGSFYAIKEIWAPIYFTDKLITVNFDGNFGVENRYHYTNLNQCSFYYELVNFPAPSADDLGYNTLAAGQISSPIIAPGKKGNLHLDLPENWNNADALYIRAVDPHNQEIYTWDWAITLPEGYAKNSMPDSGTEKASGLVKGDFLELTGENVKVRIDRNTGMISSVQSGMIPISFSSGPQLAEGSGSLKSFRSFQKDNDFLYEAEFDGNLRRINWTMHANGILQLNYIYYPDNHRPYYGINFIYPEDKMNGVTWLGKGPYRVWKNRLKGTRLNVWHKEYNNTVTGESYDYPEFKGYHSELYWAKFDTDEKPFTVFSATEDLFLRLYTPDEPTGGPMHTTMIFPEGDISFLQGISAIGTKFKDPEALGPESQLNMYQRHRETSALEIELYFDFR